MIALLCVVSKQGFSLERQTIAFHVQKNLNRHLKTLQASISVNDLHLYWPKRQILQEEVTEIPKRKMKI